MPSRLKSLELVGYKTFASRTVFEFAGAVTCIVGPNGSGKSNIADSMRWVLGEQSYSLLRGKRTEDMIFSGSEQRPRAGMASATVVFDNSDGWLPIDFSEVAITRRAYRDGENEYLINGQRVRLKDVTELLARSGLAERTYTIIGQGVVDAALALKPEERRRLFEEAAGIGLYRSRREESIRRLETTRRNLERVQDILAELRPRLHSLERQARRAQEYEQVKSNLRLLLREWYGYHWHNAQKELAAARQVARLKEKELLQARQEQAALAKELDALRGRTVELRARLNDWHRQQADLHARREQISRQLAVADERIRIQQEQAQNLEQEYARLEGEQAVQQERYATALEAVKRLEAELFEAQAQAEATMAAMVGRQTERQLVESQLQAAHQNVAELQARQGQLQARLEEAASQLSGQRQALQTVQQALVKAEVDRDQAQKRLAAAGEALAQAEAERLRAEAIMDEHKSRLDKLESARLELLEQRAAAQAQVDRLRAQLDLLAQAEASLSGYASGAAVLLQAARQSRLRGARGVLSSLLEVPAELETAIAAALGEYLDALVLDSGADEELALDLLAAQATRGVLIPLDQLKAARRLKIVEDGALGLAADLMDAPADLRPVLELLLGNTLIVPDRQSARRLLKGQPVGVRAVTLRGEVFHASGAVVVGVEGKPATLSRPRQRKELANTLDKAEGRLAEVEQAYVRLQSELEALRKQGSDLQAALDHARQVEEQARAAHASDVVALEQADRNRAWLSAQRDQIESGIARQEQALQQSRSALSLLATEIAVAQEDMRKFSLALEELGLDEFRTQQAYWNALVEANRRSLEEARLRLAEQKDLLSRAQLALAAAAERRQALLKGLQEIEAERLGWREMEAKISEQIEALRQLIEPAEAELESLDHQQSERQAAESQARQALTLAEHTHAQARIGLGRAQEALDVLRQRIQDDFGLVAFDYEEDISGPTPLPLEGMVEQLPRLTQLSPEIEENLKQQRQLLRRIGPVNPEAQSEYQQVKERYEFMTTQVADLEKAEADVRQAILELDDLMERELRNTFEAVAEEFSALFTRLFGGGSARLKLTNSEDITNAGIDIEARLPGRRVQGLSLLSGGERSLTAAALVFALIKISPTPFCVLDEVDAMLDEANVGRFRELLRELSQNTQFIVVTHNRNTVQAADVIYGVTMGKDSTSQVISLKMDEVSKVV